MSESEKIKETLILISDKLTEIHEIIDAKSPRGKAIGNTDAILQNSQRILHEQKDINEKLDTTECGLNTIMEKIYDLETILDNRITRLSRRTTALCDKIDVFDKKIDAVINKINSLEILLSKK